MPNQDYEKYLEDMEYRSRCVTIEVKKDIGLERILAHI